MQPAESPVSIAPSFWFKICALSHKMPNPPSTLHGDSRFSLPDHVVALPQAPPRSLPERFFAYLGQLACRLRGHDMLPQFNSNRLYLKCMSCGHETPGWQLPGTHPVARFHGDARRHMVERLPLTAYPEDSPHTLLPADDAAAPRRAAG
jgi:hypothetical protein